MQRQQERWDRRQARWAARANRRHSHVPGAVFGLIIVVVGVLFLLDNLGIIYYRDYLPYWPVILVVFGIARVADSCGPSGIIWGAMLAGIGGLLLVNNLGIFSMDWHMFWPVLVIGWGLLILFRNMERRRQIEAGIPGPPPNMGSAPGPGGPRPTGAGPTGPGTGTHGKGLGPWAIFSEGVGRVDDKAFKGTEVAAIFGGYKLDLREAVMAGEQAVVDVNAVFGGVEIRIPDTWVVDLRGIGVFGGFDDKTRPPRIDPNGKSQKLVITGYAVFGGAKIEN